MLGDKNNLNKIGLQFFTYMIELKKEIINVRYLKFRY